MGSFVKGDVVIIRFPFSDLSGAKKRPALLVAQLRGDDVILCQITSRNRADGYSISLSDSDFAWGSLRRQSYVRSNVLFTADSNRILYRAGRVSQKKITEVVDRIVKIVRS